MIDHDSGDSLERSERITRWEEWGEGIARGVREGWSAEIIKSDAVPPFVTERGIVVGVTITSGGPPFPWPEGTVWGVPAKNEHMCGDCDCDEGGAGKEANNG